jgi:hypothetical protein
MYAELLQIADLSEFLPLFVLLRIAIIRQHEVYLQLLDFSLLKAVIGVTGILIFSIDTIENSFIILFQNLYIVLSFLTISHLFKTILSDVNGIIFRLGNLIFLINLLINCYWFDIQNVFFNYLEAIINLIFFAYGIIFMINYKSSLINGKLRKYFLLIIGIILYNAGLFPVMCFDRIIISDFNLTIQKFLWSIVLITSICMNIILCKFLFENKIVVNEK